ncbi:MAG TPA: YHS domain-containing protein [Anaerolineae bacterium]|nr:YHS domain-containing protein [Anaerolineae bacterium]
MVKDPVCGMEIEPKEAFATREHDGQAFYFCSQSCVDKFDADPHKYGHPPKHDKHAESQGHR